MEQLVVKPRDIPKITDMQLDEWIESICRALTGDDIELARQAIRQLVAKIVVNEKAGTIFYTFPLSNTSRLHEVAPTRFEHLGLSSLPEMTQWLLEHLGLKREHSRNEIIRLRYNAGESISDIGRSLGISPQRVFQITHESQK